MGITRSGPHSLCLHHLGLEECRAGIGMGGHEEEEMGGRVVEEEDGEDGSTGWVFGGRSSRSGCLQD